MLAVLLPNSVSRKSFESFVSETTRCLMHWMVIIAAVLAIGVLQVAAAESTSTGNRKTEDRKGINVDDLGRGLKSAANNIQKEIPKMGSAIGSAFKKITEKGSDKPSPQEPATQGK